MLDIIIHKTQDEDKHKPKTTEHNMCWTPSYTRRRQTHIKHSTKYVGHNYAQTNINTVKVKARKK